MPYTTTADLPPAIRRVLPEHALAIYRAAYNHALESFGAGNEAIAHRIAWAAVKKQYVRGPSGLWHARMDGA